MSDDATVNALPAPAYTNDCGSNCPERGKHAESGIITGVLVRGVCPVGPNRCGSIMAVATGAARGAPAIPGAGGVGVWRDIGG